MDLHVTIYKIQQLFYGYSIIVHHLQTQNFLILQSRPPNYIETPSFLSKPRFLHNSSARLLPIKVALAVGDAIKDGVLGCK